MRKRLFAGLLTLVMILSLAPTTALAVGDDTEMVPCTVTEGCTLEAGHEGECVTTPAEPEDGDSNGYYEFEDVTDGEDGIMPLGADDGEETDTPMSGPCGAPAEEGGEVTDAVKWNFDSATGTLTISGSGEMADYTHEGEPWFSLQESITSAEIENGVTSIGERAFSNCKSLKAVSLPNSLTKIGNFAFFGCEALTSVAIPVSVTEVGTNPFRECAGLKEIILEGNNTAVKKDGNALLSIDGETLISYPASSEGTSYTVPSTVKTIQNGAFRYAQLTSISFDSAAGVTELGDWCFAGSTLTSITIPSTVTTMGINLFRDCTSLTSAVFNNSPTEIPNNTFYNCQSLSSFEIPATVTTIGTFAFSSTALTNVTIPESVKTIGRNAYSYNDISTFLVKGTLTNAPEIFKESTVAVLSFQNIDTLSIPTNIITYSKKVTAIDTTAYSGKIGLNTSSGQNGGFNCLTGAANTIFYSQSAVTQYIGNNADGVIWAVTNGAELDVDDILAANGKFADMTVEEGYQYDGWTDTNGSTVKKGTGGNTYYASYYPLSGTADGIKWEFDKDEGTLTISANTESTDPGKMTGYNRTSYINAPWYPFRSQIKNIVIDNDVTYLGSYAFYNYTALEYVEIEGNLASTNGNNVFNGCSPTVIAITSQNLYLPSNLFDGLDGLKVLDLSTYSGNLKINSGDDQVGGYSALSGIPANTCIIVSDNVTQIKYHGSNTSVLWVNVGAAVSDLTILTDKDTTGLSAIEKDGYSVKWYTDKDKKTELTDLSSASGTVNTAGAPTVYYAGWTQSSYSVSTSLVFEALPYGNTPVSKTFTVTASGVESPSVKSVTGSSSFGATYSGTTVTITPKSGLPVGTYNETVIVTTGDGATHNVAVILTVTKADSTVTPGDDNTGDITDTYGETITLTAKTQRATATGISLMAALDEVDFFCGQTLLGSAEVDYDESGVGTATLTYDTSKGGIPVGSKQTIFAQYGGSVNLNGSYTNSISVTLSPKALTVTGLTAADRAYDGTTAVTLSGGMLSGIVGSDDVSATLPTSGTVASADAGTGKTVTVPTISLSGADAEKYTLAPSTVSVNITKATLTITADNQTIYEGGTLPTAYTYTVTGLVGNDTESVITTKPTMTCSAADANTAGTYTITASEANAGNNYDITYKPGTLTIATVENNEAFKVDVTVGFTDVPAGLKETYKSAEELISDLKTKITQSNSAVPASNIAVYDVKLMVKTGDSGWVPATAANFPTNGLTITLPYPGDTNSSYTFTVVHMFTTSDFGRTPGNTEKPNVTNTANGIQFTVTGLSPISVGWTAPTSGGSSHSGGGSSSSTTYTVTVDSAKNGTVKADRTSASKGTTVTLTVTPKDGYELDSLKVTDKDGKTIKTTEGKNGKYTFTMPSSKVTVEASFAKIEETSKVSFVDVSTSAYYYDAVEWAVEKGITSGTSATTFSPDASCTRAQAVTFLWRAAGSPAPKNSVNPFTDVPASAYYYDAVLWAVEKGITSGTSATTFSPDATCTRGQIVTFLYRADGTAATGSNPFADVAASAYYADAVKWAVAEGVTSGTSATTFSPDASCTRAQIVTFLYRACAE